MRTCLKLRKFNEEQLTSRILKLITDRFGIISVVFQYVNKVILELL